MPDWKRDRYRGPIDTFAPTRGGEAYWWLQGEKYAARVWPDGDQWRWDVLTYEAVRYADAPEDSGRADDLDKARAQSQDAWARREPAEALTHHRNVAKQLLSDVCTAAETVRRTLNHAPSESYPRLADDLRHQAEQLRRAGEELDGAHRMASVQSMTQTRSVRD